MSQPRKHLKDSRAFTLIEVLVVIGVVSILAMLLVGQLQKMKDSTNKAKCASNLRQIGAALHIFLGDNQNTMFSDAHNRAKPERVGRWVTAIREALDQPVTWAADGSPLGRSYPLFICPSDPTKGGWNSRGALHGISGPEDSPTDGIIARSYLPNRFVINRKVSEITRPSKTIIFADFPWSNLGTLAFYPNSATWYQHYPKSWHNGLMNCLFLDGHVEGLKVDSLVWGKENSSLWYPNYPETPGFKAD
jgi:prepilin-type N-terminal cleavage/methylation domain-containing protein/prepilin-type processing-associated H-X9-DG protein